MKNKTRIEITKKIEDAYHDIVTCIEEDRYHPSVPEAGDAPTDHALDSGHQTLITLIEELAPYSIGEGDLTKGPCLDDIISEILERQDGNTGDDFSCLEEIDTFIRDANERKYQYFNTVYKYKPTGKFIAVEEQRSIQGGDFIVCGITVSETEKKEIVTMEWV